MALEPEDPRNHYQQEYFEWQRRIGRFAGRSNVFKFRPYIKPTDRVIDFGSGGGFLLANLDCRAKVGIEINPAARKEAEAGGIQTLASIEDAEDAWADVLISNSALEHTAAPLAELKRLREKVKVGGLVVFSVPHESSAWRFAPNDINQHLYTWSPMSAGNLFSHAGLKVLRVELIRRMWPPRAEWWFSVTGERLFGLVCGSWRLVRLALAWLRPPGVVADILVVAQRVE